MATKVFMPALGMAQETGMLVRWLKGEGDAVQEGEPIAEIQTDKATEELQARASGTLSGLLAREGDDVPVGQVIAMILAPGESAARSGARLRADADDRRRAHAAHHHRSREWRWRGHQSARPPHR